MVIAYLQTRRNRLGENALVLFLRVLMDRVSEEDECWGKLQECADKLTVYGEGENVSSVNDTAVNLFDLLTQRFSLEELRLLCFRLNVDHENLPDDTLQSKAKELILYLRRREQLPELTRLIRQLRPDIGL